MDIRQEHPETEAGDRVRPQSRGYAPPSSGGRPAEEEKASMAVVSSGSMTEALCGAAAVVLTIIGLFDVAPLYMAAIATIVAGAGLLLEGGTVIAQLQQLMEQSHESPLGETGLGSGMSAEFLGGAAGVVLGILAILLIAPTTLLAISGIVFGGTLLLGAAGTSQFNSLTMGERGARAAHGAVMSAAGSQVLIGLGAAVLGIIAVVNVGAAYAGALILVSILVTGAALLISGLVLGGRMMKASSRD